MKGRTLKVSDIAQETGLDEAQVRLLVENYGSVLPSRKIGRISLFEPGAVSLVRSIAELSEQGTGPDEILAKFQKKTRKTVQEVMRNRPANKPGEGKQSGLVSPVRAQPFSKPQLQPGSSGEKPLPAGGRDSRFSSSLDDSFAAQDRRIVRLIARTEALEKEISSMKAASEKYIGEQETHHAMVQDQIICTDNWINYFESRLDTMVSQQKELQESMATWVEYFDEEITQMKRSRLEKLRGSLKGDDRR